MQQPLQTAVSPKGARLPRFSNTSRTFSSLSQEAGSSCLRPQSQHTLHSAQGDSTACVASWSAVAGASTAKAGAGLRLPPSLHEPSMPNHLKPTLAKTLNLAWRQRTRRLKTGSENYGSSHEPGDLARGGSCARGAEPAPARGPLGGLTPQPRWRGLTLPILQAREPQFGSAQPLYRALARTPSWCVRHLLGAPRANVCRTGVRCPPVPRFP